MTEVQDGLYAIPTSWLWSKLSTVSEMITDGSHTPPPKQDSGIPMLSAQNIFNGKIIFSDMRYISSNDFEKEYKRAPIAPNDVLLTIVGTIGRSTVVRPNTPKFALQRSVALVKTKISPLYLSFFLQSPLLSSYLTKKARGTAQKGIYLNQLKDIPVAVAPLNEQFRIVGKIQELFSFLDAGAESLRKVQAQLKRYRQAVLKYAFEGKLTEEWRKTHKDQIEPAKKLLEQVEQERLRRSKRRKKPFSLDTSNLPKLPEGWVWTSFEGLVEDSPNAIKAGPFGSTLKKEFYVAKGFKVYGQEQVIRDDPSYGDYYIDKERYEKLESCSVKPGDILISLVGTIGKVLILSDEIEQGIINPRLVKLTLNKRLINPKYVKAYFMSSTVKEYFSLSSHGGTMDILNLSILKILPIGLPPLKEQEAIIEELERTFSLSDDLENAVDENVRRAEKLRKSILKNAFEGNLVPQDPNDEPAEKLLERIRAERAKSMGEKDTTRKKNRPKQLELSPYVE